MNKYAIIGVVSLLMVLIVLIVLIVTSFINKNHKENNYKEPFERYFDIDLRGLDNNGNFIYGDDKFFPLLLIIDNNSGITERLLNFTISGHCANNYKVDNIESGLYSKSGSILVSPHVYTTLSGYIIPNNWGGSQPYAEISFNRRFGLYSKCFGNMCYPLFSGDTKYIRKGPIPQSIGKLRNIDTLRINGNKINESGTIYLCLYVRGARRYFIKTNATSINLLENGADNIYMEEPENNNEPLLASSRYNVLKFNNDKLELIDPLIKLNENENAPPIYNQSIDLDNPNLQPGINNFINLISLDNGKRILSYNPR